MMTDARADAGDDQKYAAMFAKMERPGAYANLDPAQYYWAHGFTDGWNACRAAMLAAPPPKR